MTEYTDAVRKLAGSIFTGSPDFDANKIAIELCACAARIDELTAVSEERLDAANRYLERARVAEDLAEARLSALLAAGLLAGQLAQEIKEPE
jgi:hypothetical protein